MTTSVTSDQSQSRAQQGTNSGGFGEASPRQVRGWMESGECVLVDVREPDEHSRERIVGSQSMPLSRFKPGRAAGLCRPGQRLVLHCKGGRRSAEAARMARPVVESTVEIYSMTGGIDAWKSEKLPVDVDLARAPISIMRQVQLVVGVGVLAGCGLAWFVHPGFIVLPAFFGAGLAFAGATGTCALASLLGLMPWNKAKGACCSSGAERQP